MMVSILGFVFGVAAVGGVAGLVTYVHKHYDKNGAKI